MPAQPDETAYRINHTPEGWTVEGYGVMWGGTYPTLDEAWDAIISTEQVLELARIIYEKENL